MAGNLKDILSLSRKTARNLKQALDELAEQVINHQRRRPALVRVPINNNLRRKSQQSFLNRRSFHLWTSKYNPYFWRGGRSNVLDQLNREALRYRSSFAKPGFYPSGLYQSTFPQRGSRMFSTCAYSCQQEAVKNLTSAVRALLQSGANFGSQMKQMKHCSQKKKHFSKFSKRLTSSTAAGSGKNAEQAPSGLAEGSAVVFSLERQSHNTELEGILDQETSSILEEEMVQHERHLAIIREEIQRISENLGSLPLIMSGHKIEVFFPNCDTVKCEQLMRDLAITKGVVRRHDSTAEHSSSRSFVPEDCLYSSGSSSPNPLSSTSSKSFDRVSLDYISSRSTSDQTTGSEYTSLSQQYHLVSNYNPVLSSAPGSSRVLELNTPESTMEGSTDLEYLTRDDVLLLNV
ncbi:hypothetical protein PP7435_CHR1-1521 [Komagataella phaffii CBS 7435]|uniref:Uncharacterized protein n=2 Tax=Komagataella phaffii TaxID=460519 RepID=C4QZ95_KOMPG|nr:uncharacterized protein PAS_FragB_0074 [Komagataella phaffii GS115]AOA61827.1 GQ67_01424T0 [Komagataella phaffii]CAH2447400.1 hypothetical protein BQ9382_C1-7930 [Komagataella phaffii CBS 7435]AOA66800.1 GQ68_01440T0 [Komagataella phaffii GS115]CAY68569.1 hypothetical protein PAS_FragB_0074 [Komagataella phaffii GS115]CCA37632.1 hypothetical protein PP7435_CHR1-1521 [Komagataella phaffii CBS 7435]